MTRVRTTPLHTGFAEGIADCGRIRIEDVIAEARRLRGEQIRRCVVSAVDWLTLIVRSAFGSHAATDGSCATTVGAEALAWSADEYRSAAVVERFAADAGRTPRGGAASSAVHKVAA